MALTAARTAMNDERASPALGGPRIDRRRFLSRTAAAAVVVWTVPTVVSSEPVAAAAGSCSVLSVAEFTSGLEGWTIFNNQGGGGAGLWSHRVDITRDGGALHYGRGPGGNYATGGRNSGRVRSPQFDIPAAGPNRIRFTVWREVETRSTADYDVLRLTTQGGGPAQVLWSAGSDGGTAGAFQTHTVTIPPSLSGAKVRFQFDFDTVDGTANNFEGIYIGRFEVTACPSAPAGVHAPDPIDDSGEPPPLPVPPRG